MRTGASERLWDYGYTHLAKIDSLTASTSTGRTPYEEVTHETPDISEYLDFDFYDAVWYWDTVGDPDNPKVGRWVGVSHRVGGPLAYWILTGTGRVISRSTVQHFTEDDLKVEAKKKALDELDEGIKQYLDDDSHTITPSAENGFFATDLDDDPELAEMEEEGMDEADDWTTEAFDTYLNARLLLPKPGGEERVYARVTKRMKGPDGRPLGRAHANPLMDTRQYQVEYDDGTTDEFYANVIAENVFSQVDDEGRDERSCCLRR